MGMTDNEILKTFSRNPNQGMRELIETFTPYLYGIIRPMLHSHQDTDEVLQRTFINAWKGLAHFRGDAALKTWLHRIAIRTVWSFIKAEKNRTMNANDLLLVSAGEDAPLENPQLLLLRALSELPPKQRLIFVLRYFENMPLDRIANLIQRSQGNIKAQYHHARSKLEKYFSLLH